MTKRLIIDGDNMVVEGSTFEETRGIIDQFYQAEAGDLSAVDARLSRIERKLDEVLLYLEEGDVVEEERDADYEEPPFVARHCGEPCCPSCCGCREEEPHGEYQPMTADCWCGLMFEPKTLVDALTGEEVRIDFGWREEEGV